MATTPLHSRWNFKRKVLVYAPDPPGSPDSQTYLSATVLMSYNPETKQGIISLRATPNKPNRACELPMPTLAFPPKSIQTCSWIPKSNDNLCPARLLPEVPRCGGNVSDISTLSLQLNTTAEIFVPDNMNYLTPHTGSMSVFDTLERISQPGTIYIHFDKDQIPKEGIPQLQYFLRALQSRSIDILPLDLRRQRLVRPALNNGLPPFFPPPYREKSASEQQEPPAYSAKSYSEVVEKWRLDSPADSSENEKQERPVFPASQPLDSPTEAATPTNVSTSSIVSPSPSPIRPAVFARATTRSRTHLDRIAGLAHQLRGVPDHLIRRLLRLSDHSHLLRSEDSDSDLSYGPEKASFSKVQSNNCDSIRAYVDATVKRSLQPHVNEIADKNCTLLYDLLRDREEEFRNEVEDIYSDLRIKTDECLRELEETCQELIDQMEGRSQQCLDYIQDRGVTSTEENVAKVKLSLRRYRRRRRQATRSAAPGHTYRVRRYCKCCRRS